MENYLLVDIKGICCAPNGTREIGKGSEGYAVEIIPETGKGTKGYVVETIPITKIIGVIAVSGLLRLRK